MKKLQELMNRADEAAQTEAKCGDPQLKIWVRFDHPKYDEPSYALLFQSYALANGRSDSFEHLTFDQLEEVIDCYLERAREEPGAFPPGTPVQSQRIPLPVPTGNRAKISQAIGEAPTEPSPRTSERIDPESLGIPGGAMKPFVRAKAIQGELDHYNIAVAIDAAEKDTAKYLGEAAAGAFQDLIDRAATIVEDANVFDRDELADQIRKLQPRPA